MENSSLLRVMLIVILFLLFAATISRKQIKTLIRELPQCQCSVEETSP